MKSRILEQYEKMDDFEKITFDKLVKRCGKLYGEKIALKDLTERITYSELQKESEKTNSVYIYMDRLGDMLDSDNSYIRTRGLWTVSFILKKF